MRVVCFHQIDLVLAPVGFEGFLAPDGRFDPFVHLVPDERLAAVLLREPPEDAFPVLPDTLHKIGRDAGIERAVLPVGHHVDGNDAVFIGHAFVPF